MLLESRPAAGALLGALTPPGDKSMSHRALILGALATGETRIEGLLDSDDVRATAAALRQLGVLLAVEGTQVRLMGRGAEGFDPPTGALDMGNSGTAMRLLAGVLAAQPFASRLVGDASLSRRPMRRIIEPLRAMGADISASGEGRAPLTIVGRPLHGLDYASPVASAQVKSCVLLAGLFAKGRTRVREPVPSRDHTERMLGLFGAPLDAQGWLEGGAQLHGRRFRVPADISSAAFPLAAAVLTPGSDILLRNVGLNSTRTGLLDAVRAMGADLEIRLTPNSDSEPAGDIRVRYSGRLRAININGEQIPGMVDEIPVLMALAATAEGMTRIRGAAELRLKESDRLAVMGGALRALDVGIQLYADGADIEGRESLRDVAELDSAGDHRCAMSLAVLGTRTGVGLRIRQAQYIATSYPDFVRHMNSLGANLRMVGKV
jgi:3-phosphoshikimate 1-carboxyvinyltransferase